MANPARRGASDDVAALARSEARRKETVIELPRHFFILALALVHGMVFRQGASSAGVVIAAVGAHLVGADASDGRVLWKRTIGAVKERSVLLIALQHDRVIVGRGNDLLSIDQRSGRIVWKTESPIAMLTLLVDGERIFVSYVGEVACFDTNGSLLWHEALHGGEGRMSLAAGGTVVQGADDPDWRR